jgi:hypothetical protein
MQTNLEAAKEVGRQIRLRNYSGWFHWYERWESKSTCN